MRKFLFSLLFSLLSIAVYSQTHPCGFNTYMQQRYEEEPTLLDMRVEYEEEIQSIINSRTYFSQKTIPVVIHIIYNDSYSNISNSQVYSALTALNEDFNASNSDFSSVVSSFSGVKSDVEITFSLANIAPDGSVTSGITRTQSDLTDSAGENVKSLVLWDTDMYLNIWVVDNIESGAGAYAYYPGTAPSGAEGIVCRHNQFGTTGTSSSSNFAATTLTHEIGHYLNLAHTWGDSNDPELSENCGYDDNVDDTPNTIGTLYGCNTSQSTCSSLDNVQNFMDYTECTNMFTEGQRSRVHAALHSAQGGRVNLWQYENLLATGVLDESDCELELIAVQIHTGTYSNEVSWVILDSDGEGIAGGGGTYSNNSNYYSSVCLPHGNYTFQSIDSYGDGWNGGYYYVRDCDNTIIANDSNPSGYGESQSFVVDICAGEIEGCTNPFASNYNPEATENDGSCIVLGCTNPEADNYNPGANQDDDSCVFYGCTDNTALNYDSQANEDDGSCEYPIVPDLFIHEFTGSNHTIVIPDEMVFNLLEGPISNSDIIGVFYSDENGIEHCGGYIIWQGIINSIAAQGDDTTTDEIDGFAEGVEFQFKIWDYSDDMLFDCTVYYNTAMPNQEYFTTNGISAITSGHVIPPVTDQEIDFPLGWSIFSSYLTLEAMDVAVVLNPIFDNLVIVKDFQGLAYLPDWSYNGIGDMILGQSYQVKVIVESNLTLEGEYVFPEDVQILLPLGWSLFGYLRTEPATCSDVLDEIQSEVIIAKDYLGNAYLPEWNFNGIGDLKPSQGYQIKMNSPQVLQYISNLENY